MSIQLMIVAAYLGPDVVTQGQKLALMKLCDSADDETRLSRPGMVRLRAFVGVGRARATTIVTELVEKGLVERVEVGRPGRAAQYRVFPGGSPGIPSTEELRARHAAADAAPKNSAKARASVPRARPSQPARTAADVADRKARAKASEADGFHGRNPEAGPGQVPPVQPAGSTGGTQQVPPVEPCPSSVLPDSFLHPPTPAAGAAGETRAEDPGKEPAAPESDCPSHRKPAANCRACGTSPRAQRARRDAARRKADQSEAEQFHRELRAEAGERRRKAEQGVDAISKAQEAAKAAVRQSQEKRKRMGGPVTSR
ncbi:hypothetical protein ACFYUY_04685 [Kitasatospora sp. NPDC004745]|uniref:hypothetical protein n=1 Tax=Kitasatospora sp. NPDC004745 TaxID=3364019 RepID=UPI0036A74F30